MELVEEAKKTCPDPVVLIEQRLDYSKYVEEGFGTGDCVIIADGTLHIVDYKHGRGVLVEADDNPQMKLYALGALELFDCIYDIDTVSMTIYQPRRSNVSTFTIPKDELYEWADQVLAPTAELAFNGDGEYHCGEWCQFCKAKADCRERANANMELAKFEFRQPPLLTDEEVEEILGRIDELIAWASDIKDYALQAAISGKQWSGYKLVEGRSNRKYTDENAVIAAVTAAGYDPYEHKILGVTAMTALLGKKQFNDILEDLQTTLAEMDIPVETGIFSDKAPEQYLVIIPLADTFDLHADNAPGVDVQEARLSLFTTGSYTTAKNKLIRLLLRDDFTITGRLYNGYETETSYILCPCSRFTNSKSLLL